MNRPGKPGQDTEEAAGDFLARWSRRKLEGRDSAAEPGADPANTSVAASDPAAPSQPEHQVRELTDADMPPLETLDAESDYAPFMSPGVSDGLRRMALRKLFNQPDFNVTDGLNDYDDDYTQFASLGGVVTHEMKRMLLRELERRQTEPPAAEVAATASPDAAEAGPALADAVTADNAAAGNDAPEAVNAGPQDKAPDDGS